MTIVVAATVFLFFGNTRSMRQRPVLAVKLIKTRLVATEADVRVIVSKQRVGTVLLLGCGFAIFRNRAIPFPSHWLVLACRTCCGEIHQTTVNRQCNVLQATTTTFTTPLVPLVLELP